MANLLIDVALWATVGRGAELDLHLFLALGSMHLELSAGSNRCAIIPCAFEVSRRRKTFDSHCYGLCKSTT